MGAEPRTGTGRSPAADKVIVENVNHPGDRRPVDRALYEAMKKAMLTVLPRKLPGLTPAEILAAVLPVLPQAAFPGGQRAGWWAKCVQLDLEAKGQIVRDRTARPLRLTRA
jgi:hypothetical protein